MKHAKQPQRRIPKPQEVLPSLALAVLLVVVCAAGKMAHAASQQPLQLALPPAAAEPTTQSEDTMSTLAPDGDLEPEASVKTVICIGDSITYGYGLDNPASEAWPALMQARLGDGWNVVNLGVSGTTLIDEGTYPYRDTGNVEKAKRLDASIVIIMLGSNDAVDADWDADTYEQQLTALVDELKRAYGNDVRFVLMAPPCMFYPPNKPWSGYGYYDAYGNYVYVSGGYYDAYGNYVYVDESDEETDDDGYDESLFEQDEDGGDVGAEQYVAYNPTLSDDVRSIVERVADKEGALYIDLYAFTEAHPSWYLDGDHLNEEGNRAVCDYLLPLIFPEATGTR